jgi:hypothetical protein
MMMQFLADTGGEGIYMSVAAITAVGVAVVAVIKAYRAGVQKGAAVTETTIKKPVPTVTIREEASWAKQPDLDDHVGWTRDEFSRVWAQFVTERHIDNEELGKIHERINQQSTATASLKGSVEKIGENVSQLLHLALHGKTPPRPR